MPGLSSEARDLHNALVMHFTVWDWQRSDEAPATDHIQKYQHTRVHHWMRKVLTDTEQRVQLLQPGTLSSHCLHVMCKNNGLAEGIREKARHQESKNNFSCFTVLTRADFPTPPEPRTTSLYSRMMQEINRPQYLKHTINLPVLFNRIAILALLHYYRQLACITRQKQLNTDIK